MTTTDAAKLSGFIRVESRIGFTYFNVDWIADFGPLNPDYKPGEGFLSYIAVGEGFRDGESNLTLVKQSVCEIVTLIRESRHAQ